MKYFKFIGWILLIAGLGIIGWTLITSYNIFTAKTEAPTIFKLETEEISVSEKPAVPVTQIQIQRMIGEQLKEALPFDLFLKTFNLAAWSILAFILIFGGSQISGLGIKLIKK